jgi:DNA-binding transcriptional regulator WhiA
MWLVVNISCEKLTVEKAEIIGLLCAEGSHYRYSCTYMGWARDSNKKYRRTQLVEGVEFTNLDKKLLEHFRKLLMKVYGYAPRITGVPTSLKIRIKKKAVVKDLIKFTDFGHNKWRVPKAVKNGDSSIVSAFVRGLYEGDGIKLQRPSKNTYFVGFNMKNIRALKQLRTLIEKFGIKTRTWRNDTENMQKLIIYGISDIRKFKNLIKPKFKEIIIAEEGAEVVVRIHPICL